MTSLYQRLCPPCKRSSLDKPKLQGLEAGVRGKKLDVNAERPLDQEKKSNSRTR
jgi:hypothetical protein